MIKEKFRNNILKGIFAALSVSSSGTFLGSCSKPTEEESPQGTSPQTQEGDMNLKKWGPVSKLPEVKKYENEQKKEQQRVASELNNIYKDFKGTASKIKYSEDELSSANEPDKQANIMISIAKALGEISIDSTFVVSGDNIFKGVNTFDGKKNKYQAKYKGIIEKLRKSIEEVISTREKIAGMLKLAGATGKYGDGIDFNDSSTYCKQDFTKFLSAIEDALNKLSSEDFTGKFTENGENFDKASAWLSLYLLGTDFKLAIKDAANESEIIDKLHKLQSIANKYSIEKLKNTANLSPLPLDKFESICHLDHHKSWKALYELLTSDNNTYMLVGKAMTDDIDISSKSLNDPEITNLINMPNPLQAIGEILSKGKDNAAQYHDPNNKIEGLNINSIQNGIVILTDINGMLSEKLNGMIKGRISTIKYVSAIIFKCIKDITETYKYEDGKSNKTIKPRRYNLIKYLSMNNLCSKIEFKTNKVDNINEDIIVSLTSKAKGNYDYKSKLTIINTNTSASDYYKTLFYIEGIEDIL